MYKVVRKKFKVIQIEIGPSKIIGRQPLKNLKEYGLLKQTISLQFFFEGCLPRILLILIRHWKITSKHLDLLFLHESSGKNGLKVF